MRRAPPRPGLPNDLLGFFAGYAAAFDAASPARIAAHFALPAMIADADGPRVLDTRDRLHERLETIVAQFRSIGYQRAGFDCKHHARLGEAGAFVDLAWSIECAARGPHRFGTAYTLLRLDAGWRVGAAYSYRLQA